MYKQSITTNVNKDIFNKCNLEECHKKLQLTDFKCKCNNTYCSKHRLPETHSCHYDYKTAGRDLLNKQNQSCVAKKVLAL